MIPGEDTKITIRGVFRCCIESIGDQARGMSHEEGDCLTCEHCNRQMSLQKDEGDYIWKPNEDSDE